MHIHLTGGVKNKYIGLIDPERKKESVKAYYDQNRELILASKQAQYQANPKEKKSYEVGVYLLGAISKFIRAQGNGISFACVLASRLRFTMLFASPPPPPPPHVSSVRYAIWPMACW